MNKATIAVMCIGLGCCVVAALVVYLRSEVKKKIAMVSDKFNEVEIFFKDTRANYYGIKSKGVGQARGNGIFVLTKTEIYFTRFFSKVDISIPLSSIRGIREGKSFLGKSRFVSLLILEYGEGEEIAWAVTDLEVCVKNIKELAEL